MERFLKKLIVVVFLCSASPAFASERILALAPHVCEVLYAIGAGEDVVGAVSYCDYPIDAKDVPRVGAYNRVNVEAAIALSPTIAIVSNMQILGVSNLKKLGVKVVQSNPQKVDEVLADIRRLGQITGHQKQALQLVNKLQKRLDALPMQYKSIPVFYEIWAEPLLTAGKHTFINDVLQRIGLHNVFGDVDLEAPRVNMEAVIAAKPQVVIVPSEKRDVEKRRAFWHKWLGKEVRVIAVNPDLMHRPGPRLLDGMEYLSQALYPEFRLEH